MTTRDKVLALVDAVKQTTLEELAPETRQLAEVLQIASGFGIDPLSWMVPDTDAEADILVDKLIAILLEIRGDDLPPFDPDRYGEAAAA